MTKNVFLIKRGWLILLFLLVFIPHGCDSTKRYIGTYVSVNEEEFSPRETIIQLKEADSGVWTTDKKEVTFRWSVKGKQIRLHTKEGGVIIGEIINDSIKLPLQTCWIPEEKRTCLPSYTMVTFKKQSPY